MRILTHLLSLERLGGLEIQTVETSRALLARGHELHVFFGAGNGESGLPSTLGAELEKAGAVLHGPFPFSSSLKGALPAVARFLPAARLARQLRPDVVWLQRPEQIVWGQTVSRVAGRPLVSHLHHTVNYRGALPIVNRGVRSFLAVSEFIGRRFVDGGIPAERVHVVHNAVADADYPAGGTEERTAARARLGLPHDVPIVTYYGRLEEGKGLAVTLDAWEELGVRAGEALLVVAGFAPPYVDPEGLPARVMRMASSGTVRLLPNQDDVVPLLHATDLVLFPTLLEESFGRIALESLMTARPVVASRIGALPEVLGDDLGELLVPPGDAGQLAGAIRRHLHWREQDPSLGSRCRARAEEAFSFDAHVERVESLLARAAGLPRPVPSTTSAI